jgi:hypothetical protein
MLQELFTIGRLVDFVILFVAVEALILVWYHRRDPLGPGAIDIVVTLLAGLCLLLALRAGLAGASWLWIAAFLTASLVAHVADLRRRGWI